MRLRDLLRRVRHLPDRLLHARRREASVARVRAVRPVRSVLFVCLGNINRSAYASAALRKLTDGRIRVSSAGFIGPGRRVPERSREVARRRGVDLSDHESRLVTAGLAAEVDLVVVMDRSQRRQVRALGDCRVELLGDFDPDPIETRMVRDPWGQPSAVADAVFARIDRCLEVLVEAITEGGASPGVIGPSR